MKPFLALRHWQLFALQMGPILVVQLFLFSSLLQTGAAIGSFLRLFAIALLFFAGTFFGWLFAVATGLHPRLPAAVPMHLNRLRAALFIPAFYLAAVLAYLLNSTTANSSSSQIMLLTLVMVPLHLLSMASLLYALYFTAKLLKAVELQRPVALADYLGELLMIWFFPIGIWFIQPRVQAIMGAASLGAGPPRAGRV